MDCQEKNGEYRGKTTVVKKMIFEAILKYLINIATHFHVDIFAKCLSLT